MGSHSTTYKTQLLRKINLSSSRAPTILCLYSNPFFHFDLLVHICLPHWLSALCEIRTWDIQENRGCSLNTWVMSNKNTYQHHSYNLYCFWISIYSMVTALHKKCFPIVLRWMNSFSTSLSWLQETPIANSSIHQWLLSHVTPKMSEETFVPVYFWSVWVGAVNCILLWCWESILLFFFSVYLLSHLLCSA